MCGPQLNPTALTTIHLKSIVLLHFCCSFKLRPCTIITTVTTVIIIPSSLPDAPLVLPGAVLRSLGSSGHHPTRPWSFQVPPYAPSVLPGAAPRITRPYIVLLDATQRTLGPSGRRPRIIMMIRMAKNVALSARAQ